MHVIMFIVGLLFGSFGSVILHRLGEHITWSKVRSVLIGRSHCPHCHKTLAWYDLIPLLSWLSTRGKCRYCGAKVSHWYPLLELGSGLVFLAITYWRTLYGGGDMTVLFFSLLLHWSLYLLIIYDIQTMYLHPVAFWMAGLGGLGLLFSSNQEMGPWTTGIQWVLVFTLGFLFFYWLAKVYVRVRRKQRAEGIGRGDVMLAPIVGVVLGKSSMSVGIAIGWMEIVQYFRYYVITACVASLLLLIVIPITHENGKRVIPFFPGMIVGVWIIMLILPWLVSYMP